MTLSTKTPRDFFSKHQLVLHVAKSEMDKVRVFQDNGESPLAVPSLPPAKGTQPLHTLLGENSRAPPPCQVLRIEEAAGSELEGLSERMGTERAQTRPRQQTGSGAGRAQRRARRPSQALPKLIVCVQLFSLSHTRTNTRRRLICRNCFALISESNWGFCLFSFFFLATACGMQDPSSPSRD